MIASIHTNIFRNASKTYYYSSLFFPKEVRDDIFILYAFVRTADDLVDTLPQRKIAFRNFLRSYKKALIDSSSKNIILDSFVKMINRRKINKIWINSFLNAMENDLYKKSYKSLKQTENYMYGSADVIGLMIAKILDLPKESYIYARYLGKSMQFSNFIRDIEEDNGLGRCYFPQDELRKFKLKSLFYSETSKNKKQFIKFIRFQINRYLKWQKEAEKGFIYIPKKYRIAIKTASDMYKKTQEIIYKDPFIIYEKKVKPTKLEVLGRGLLNSFSA